MSSAKRRRIWSATVRRKGARRGAGGGIERTVLEDRAVRDGDLVALVGDDDDSSTEGLGSENEGVGGEGLAGEGEKREKGKRKARRRGTNDVLPEPNVSVDRNMVRLDDVGDRLKPLLEVGHLLKRVSELHNGCGLEDPVGVHDKRAVLERVEVRRDEEQVRARLDGQEPVSGDVDALCVAEVLDSCADGGLELDDGLAVVGDLVVDTERGRKRLDGVGGEIRVEGTRRDEHDLHRELLLFHDSLDGLDVNPNCEKQKERSRTGQLFVNVLSHASKRLTVVGVEDLELFDRLEVLEVLGRDLGDLEKSDVSIDVDELASERRRTKDQLFAPTFPPFRFERTSDSQFHP